MLYWYPSAVTIIAHSSQKCGPVNGTTHFAQGEFVMLGAVVGSIEAIVTLFPTC